MYKKINASLAVLSEKYNLERGEVIDRNGMPALRTAAGCTTALLPWRIERRFMELKNFITGKTLDNHSTLRFASQSAGGDLSCQLGKELDLATWMIDSEAISLFAACSGKNTANVIVKFANGMSASIECGNLLPAGSDPMDRHEIIAGRGVASDQSLDTQVRQYSIYAFTDSGVERFTDIDSELFSFTDSEIWLTRAAMAVLAKPELGECWEKAAEKMTAMAAAVFDSDKTASVIALGGK